MKMVDKAVNEKNYGKTNTKSRFTQIALSLYHLFSLFFFHFSFFLLEVSEVSNYLIWLFSKLMPANLSQHRGVVGAFDSRFIHFKQHNIFKNAFSLSEVKQLKKYLRYLQDF